MFRKLTLLALLGANLCSAVPTKAEDETSGRKLLAAAVRVFNRFTLGRGGITAFSDDLAQSNDKTTTIRRLTDCTYGLEVAPPFETHLDIIDFASLTGKWNWAGSGGLSGDRVTLVFQGTSDKTRCFQIGNGNACTRNLEIGMDRYFLQETIDDVTFLHDHCADRPE